MNNETKKIDEKEHKASLKPYYVKQILKEAGAKRVSTNAVHLLTDILTLTAYSVAEDSIQLTEHRGGKTLTDKDILLAIQYLEEKPDKSGKMNTNVGDRFMIGFGRTYLNNVEEVMIEAGADRVNKEAVRLMEELLTDLCFNVTRDAIMCMDSNRIIIIFMVIMRGEIY